MKPEAELTAMRKPNKNLPAGKFHTSDYLKRIGVPDIPPSTSPFDPGYDPVTLESHLDQSAHLISILKISMACWMVAKESATRQKIAAARKHKVPTVTGGGPFEIAVAQGELPAYLDLCADVGVTRIECGMGFTDMPLKAMEVVKMAEKRGLKVQFELGKKQFHSYDCNFLLKRICDLTIVQLDCRIYLRYCFETAASQVSL